MTKPLGHDVAVRFSCPIIDEARLEQVLRHNFGATNVVTEIKAVFDRPVRGGGGWRPREGTAASDMLSLVEGRQVVRWRELAGLRDCRRSLETLLDTGLLIKVAHGVFRAASADLDDDAAMRVAGASRPDLGEAQRRVYEALTRPATATEIQEMFGGSRQATDQILKKLLRQGLVRRYPTPGEASSYVYAQATARTVDVLADREPSLSALEAAILQILPPTGSIRSVTLTAKLGPSARMSIKGLRAKGLVEVTGTTKRQYLHLTPKGLSHSHYRLEGDHLPEEDANEALHPAMLKILLSLEALGESRAIELGVVAETRSSNGVGTGQYVQRLRVAGYISQERPKEGGAPVYRLTKRGVLVLATARASGQSIDPKAARAAVASDAHTRAEMASSRSASTPGKGRTSSILRLVCSEGPLTAYDVQAKLDPPFAHTRSANLALADLERRGWIECARTERHGLKFWKLTSSGADWLSRHDAFGQTGGAAAAI
jgi:DNA-binding PadR family transcriptional regulator/DNA-binding MarR family transcriptional regulator